MAKPIDDLLRPTEDSRSYFMLPQSPAESGYYTYGKLDGKPDRGAYQYAHPLMMTAILRVGWSGRPSIKGDSESGTSVCRVDGRTRIINRT